MSIATTNQLRNYPYDGSLTVGYDGEHFQFWGITEQASGDVVVQLESAEDPHPFKHDVEVAKADMDEEYWDL